jgi:hypothetical protein
LLTNSISLWKDGCRPLLRINLSQGWLAVKVEFLSRTMPGGSN